MYDKESEINETLLAVYLKVTQSERLVGAAFINLHERRMMITEFSDNEHFSGLESLVIQQNNTAADAKFKVLVHIPGEVFRDKIQDTLQMCEVEFSFATDKKDWVSNNIHISLD